MLEVPKDVEVHMIEQAEDGWLRAATVPMGQAGLTAGALPSLSIFGGRYRYTTKGKQQSGKTPAEAREAITRTGQRLPLRSPSMAMSVHLIEGLSAT